MLRQLLRLATVRVGQKQTRPVRVTRCLLYTSDAADERSSVDLGGRRLIQKKKKENEREKEKNTKKQHGA